MKSCSFESGRILQCSHGAVVTPPLQNALVGPCHELRASLCLELLSRFPTQAQRVLLCVCSFPVQAVSRVSRDFFKCQAIDTSALQGSHLRACL